MTDGKKDDIELAGEFFKHDVDNKRQVIDGYQELIEQTDDIDTVHGYAKKIRDTRRDISEMAEDAEQLVENDEKTELDLQSCVQDSLDRLHSSIEYHGSSVAVNWNADDYTAELNPTVENMLYNLFDNSVEHGDSDIEIEVDENEEGLELKVYDGGNVEDWDDIFPEGAESRDDYPSTGAYLIDTVAEKNDIEIEGSDDWSYKVKIPG